MKGNPLYDRLIRDAKGPSLRVYLWTGFALGLSATILMSFGISPMESDVLALLTLLCVGLFVSMVLFAPLITAINAATLTARDVQGEGYQLLRLTNLSGAAIVWGYVAAALYRVRTQYGRK